MQDPAAELFEVYESVREYMQDCISRRTQYEEKQEYR
jgi:hypothetical protein